MVTQIQPFFPLFTGPSQSQGDYIVYIMYFLDYIKYQVEGTLRKIANPHSEERMALILKQLLEDEKCVEEEENNCEVDEVTMLYYGDQCNCGKMAKCISSKCICFIRGVKCGSECHSSVKTNCTNK